MIDGCAATAWLGELLHTVCAKTSENQFLAKSRAESAKHLWSVYGTGEAVRRTFDRFIWNSPYVKMPFVFRIVFLVLLSTLWHFSFLIVLYHTLCFQLMVVMRTHGTAESDDISYLAFFSFHSLFSLVYAVQVFTRTRKLIYCSDQRFPKILGSFASFLWLALGSGMLVLSCYRTRVLDKPQEASGEVEAGEGEGVQLTQVRIGQLILMSVILLFVWLPTSR